MTELPVRVAVPSGRHRDLLLDVPTGARVGDAAVALAAALGSRVKALYRDAAELPADLVLADAGVVPGTTLGWGAPAPAVLAIGAVAEVRLVDGTSRPVSLRGTCVVGRGGADIDVADPTVSRRHALMGAVPGGVMVTDLGGRNGTWVDGRRITNASALASFGATVRVGESEMTIRPRPPTPPAAAWGADGSVAPYVSDPGATPPATIRLGPGAGRVSVAGPRSAQLALVRHLLVQLAQASEPWHLVVVASAGGDAWRWSLWLPQLAVPFVAGRRAVAARPRARAARLAEVQAEIAARAAGERRGQPVVVVLDGPAPAPAMADIAARGPATGVYVIHLPGEGDAPIADATALLLESTGGLVTQPGRRAFAFAPASCAVEVADEAARAIAAASMSCAIAPTAGPRVSIPDPPALAEIWCGDPRPVLVGTRNGEPLTLNLAEPGRHTLIRGGRGSGRTSTLRTIAAAAALAYGPDRLRIVAVDPIGELTELRGLPHTDWTVSRLDISVLQAIEAAAAPLVLVFIDGFDALHAADSRLIARLRTVGAQASVRLVVATDCTPLPRRLESLFAATLVLADGSRRGSATWAEAGETEAISIAHLPPCPVGDPVPKVIALDIDALAEPRRAAADSVRCLDALVDAATAAAASAATSAPPRRGVEPALRVLLVEDHAVLAEMIEAGLERGGCSVVATCSTVEDALEAVGLAAIDIAIVDVDMGTSRRSMLGVDVIEALRAAVPALPVVALSRHARPDTATVDRIMRLAPEAFVSEATAADGLVGVVRQVAGGGRYVSPALRASSSSFAFDQMTAAEQRLVIELARDPDTRARLARRLHLSISTVDSHLRAVKAKVAVELAARGGLAADGVVSTEALIGWALEHGYDRAAVARPARAATSERR